ncbi:MAG: hypothetical protein Kow0032_05960 [Methyloligellaceae bacterium]
MNNETNEKTQARPHPAVMSQFDFARLGSGQVAYIRTLRSGEAARMFPNLQGIPEGIELYALVGANGMPLSLHDTPNGAFATAIEHDLEPVSLH